MILKKLKLNNIRSYSEETLEFPEGNVMLSGDIGAGKSSVLLGIEFALFGILRGDLSGSSLLRHGETKGFVELTFELNGEEIIINRNLRRTKNGISQESGFIIRDGLMKKATPLELKSEIINLLGYPKSLVSKSKNLIYRFTVYTPQEQMKAILYENSDSRLDILRKLFSIDKYKIIRNNITPYLKYLREEIKLFEGQYHDLINKENELNNLNKKIKLITNDNSKLKPILSNTQNKIKLKLEELNLVEEKIKKLYLLKQDLSVCDSEQKSFLLQLSKNKSEFETINLQIKNLEVELKPQLDSQLNPQSDSQLNSQLDSQLKNQTLTQTEAKIKTHELNKHKEIKLIEDNIKNLIRKIAEINLQKRQSQTLTQKINNLNNCPTCIQTVSVEHKKSIFNRENEKLNCLNKEFEEIKIQNNKLEESLQISKKDLNFLIQKEKLIAVNIAKTKTLNDFLKRREQINEFLSSAKKTIGALNIKKMELQKQINEFIDIEIIQSKLKSEFVQLQLEERKLEIEFNQSIREIENLTSFVKKIQEEINLKLLAKKRAKEFSQIHSWLKDFFLPLTTVIEKQVFTKIFHQFNSFFQSWFSILMEDESLHARLDDTFSPVLIQNGYETSISNLSGGEKTACALAYRLSLNRVVNDFIGNIQTKDLLILDEPTDGFSSDQLDKIRDVLDELGGKQTLIVSHESKIESFMDSIIRLSKNEHISSVRV